MGGGCIIGSEEVMELRDRLIERFIRYALVPTQSDASKDTVPSSEGQWVLARMLMEELAGLGAEDIHLSEYCVLTARFPADEKHAGSPAVGWVVHLDTADIGMSGSVTPVLVRNYRGGDILQDPEGRQKISVREHPELEKYIGDDILVSDGTSVLGADDKAAMANVMCALETIVTQKLPHGDIYVAFVPDEEIGLRGAGKLELSRFPVDWGYTVDCCELGEVAYRTFNAASAQVDITGINAHPMSAKNVMVNAVSVAVDIISGLDPDAVPEKTEGTEGFMYVTSLEGSVSSARIGLNIRDHDRILFDEKKRALAEACERAGEKHPGAKISLAVSDTYSNIEDSLMGKDRTCVDHIFRAMEELGIAPKDIAMRGGTDGSLLSAKGIPVPNYFTGAHNFHSLAEFLPVSSLEASARLTLRLIALCCGEK
ncbi:MAG: peptidase T [Eubacteriaceae bacterium]|nr:peptidase T [Eubacteriaceae bacterium]